MPQKLLAGCSAKLIELIDFLASLAIKILKVLLTTLSVILTCYIIIMVMTLAFGEESAITLLGTL